MVTAASPTTTMSSSSNSQDETPTGGDDGGGGLLGGKIKVGEGGIKQALEEGKGWSDADVLAYAKTIGDNHPMFAESLEEMDPAMIEAIQAIKFEGKNFVDLAKQAKDHGNSLFAWGKKNPAQYQICLKSYNEAEAYASQIPVWVEPEEGEEKDEQATLKPTATPSGGGGKEEEGGQHPSPDENKREKALLREEKAHLLSTICSNRAFAHLMTKNYGSCKKDCDRALYQWPGNLKAYYRKAKACQALGQHEEVIVVCEKGLEATEKQQEEEKKAEEAAAKEGEATPPPPTAAATTTTKPAPTPAAAAAAAAAAAGKELKEMRDKSVHLLKGKLQALTDKQNALKQRIEARRQKLREAWKICSERKIKVGQPFYNSEEGEGGGGGGEARRQVEALPRIVEGEGVCVWPVLFLYPEYQVSDFVECVEEEVMLAMTLAELLPEAGEGPPPPFDERGEYRCSNVEVYFEARREKGEVLKGEGEYVEAVEGFYALCGVGGGDYDKEEHQGGGGEGEAKKKKKKAALAKRNIWKSQGEYWVHLHVGCTLLEVLQHAHHVVPATVPTFHVFVRDSRVHKEFLKRAGVGKIETLVPGQMSR